MRDRRDIEELKRLGAGKPASAMITELYREAFETFGVESLWSSEPTADPTLAQVLAIAEPLRKEGNMRSWSLAARIDESCRAAF